MRKIITSCSTYVKGGRCQSHVKLCIITMRNENQQKFYNYILILNTYTYI